MLARTESIYKTYRRRNRRFCPSTAFLPAGDKRRRRLVLLPRQDHTRLPTKFHEDRTGLSMACTVSIALFAFSIFLFPFYFLNNFHIFLKLSQQLYQLIYLSVHIFSVDNINIFINFIFYKNN